MTTVATVISARTASKRLPGKALLDLGGVPMIQFLIDRIRKTRLGGRIIFATTKRPDDDELAARVAGLDIAVFRGADADVAERHLTLAHEFGLDWIVRVTGDCPFVDSDSLDFCLSQWRRDDEFEIMSTKGVFPVGIDYELFSTAILRRAWPKMSDEEKEHLTLRFYRPELGFRVGRFAAPASWSAVRTAYVVDTQDDYRKAASCVQRLGNRTFSVEELLDTGV